MLGRLVVPASQLAEADVAARRAGASVDEPWRVSALVGTAEQSEAIAAAMIDDHRRPRSVRVEAIEAVAATRRRHRAIGANRGRASSSATWRFPQIPIRRR